MAIMQAAAPEVVRAAESASPVVTADTATDIWALGVLAYELLNSSHVFPVGTPQEMIRKAIFGIEPMPWEENSEIEEISPLQVCLSLHSSDCLSRSFEGKYLQGLEIFRLLLPQTKQPSGSRFCQAMMRHPGIRERSSGKLCFAEGHMINARDCVPAWLSAVFLSHVRYCLQASVALCFARIASQRPTAEKVAETWRRFLRGDDGSVMRPAAAGPSAESEASSGICIEAESSALNW
jgi:serine/threonine protein kinase